ncbi:hypothetical protein [Spirillospora sp. CA-128828]|uniref:hypothetical protein n=1 Tax=Spirillospora sp. CA-128828 TaxID=3240033 RepID=UPI003D90FE9C
MRRGEPTSGRAAWRPPGRVARVVPNADVEGERLRHLLRDAEPPAAEREPAPARS